MIKIRWLYFWNPIKYYLRGDKVLGQNYWISNSKINASDKLEIMKICITQNMADYFEKMWSQDFLKELENIGRNE